MKRAWIGVALLAASWLLGLDYYHGTIWICWVVVVAIGAALFGGVVGDTFENADERRPGRIESAAALLLVLPAVWLSPWPYRAAPLLIVAGLAPLVAGLNHRRTLRFSLGWSVAGLVLLAQGLAMELYAHWTARSHDLPAPLAALVSGVAWLLGIDAGVNEHNVLLHTMRESYPLGATWGLFFDPATFCFLIGGLALIGVRVWSVVAADRRLAALWAAVWRLSLALFAWLPVRCGLLMALYMHRALRTDFDAPLKLMGQFWNSWLHLALLAGPVLLAWRFVRIPTEAGIATGVNRDRNSVPARQRMAAAIGASAAAAVAVLLFVAGQFWDPPGERKAGRVAVDEAHSDWERTDKAMDVNSYGHMSGYNYACIYDYLSRFYDMSRIMQGPIDDKLLDKLDVLIIKTPTARYKPEEVQAIVRFVDRGGGLMLIGEHTDVFRTGEYLNEISRNFGFTFRYDVLFGVSTFPYDPLVASRESTFDELYVRPLIPHPITQTMQPLDFQISCSIDPGSSSGQAVMTNTSLWSLPPDYHALNYYPQVEDRADARSGNWIQTWATRQDRGRVVAYTDSTQFSNFSTFEPGKAEVMMGMVEWLNHRGGHTSANGWLTAAAILLGALSLFLARRANGGWLALVGAGVFGWFVAVLAIRAAHAAELPMPEAKRPLVRVVMDRTISDAPLPKGGFIGGRADAFGLFEQNVLRLGYFTSRKSGAESLTGDLLIVLNPNLDVPASFRDAVVKYVEEGGKLLVIDSLPAAQGEAQTSNSLLHPFGLAIAHEQLFNGNLTMADGGLPIPVTAAYRVLGGRPIASLSGSPESGGLPVVVAATKQHGKGTVTVVGFGFRFADVNMGVTDYTQPDADLRKIFEMEYQLLRGIVGSKASPQK